MTRSDEIQELINLHNKHLPPESEPGRRQRRINRLCILSNMRYEALDREERQNERTRNQRRHS